MARFEFVEYNCPDKPSQPRHRVVRAHAPRNVAARRERVEQYRQQKQKQQDAERAHQLERDHAADITFIDRGQWVAPWVPKMGTVVGFLQRHPEPLDVLSAARMDPYQSFSRQMTPMDQFLLDHCRWPCDPNRQISSTPEHACLC